MTQTTAVNYLSSARLNQAASIFRKLEVEELASRKGKPIRNSRERRHFRQSIRLALYLAGLPPQSFDLAEIAELEEENYHTLVEALREF